MDRPPPPYRGNYENRPPKRFLQDDMYNSPPPVMNKNYEENRPFVSHGGYYNNYEPPKRRKMESEVLNHIILVTIMNPAYPITVDVLKTICQPYGNVLRIVIFKKNGVKAMIEFDSIEAATRTKDGLQGADVYSGCCTLRIEYAKVPDRLNVVKNNAGSWDYTNPNLGVCHPDQPGNDVPNSQMDEPNYGRDMNRNGGPSGGSDMYNNSSSDRYGNRSGDGLAGPAPGDGSFMGGGGGPPRSKAAMDRQASSGLRQGAVLMVYGLPKDTMNADKLFNLFCLYGNVIRVKFLKTKDGCAMVQMGDASAVDRCIDNLNNVAIFENKLQLGYSKQAFLADVHQPYDLADGTTSFKDFMGNKNNRFLNSEMASKNRIQPPSKILHFYNTPPLITVEDIEKIFTELGVTKPASINIFPAKTDRSSSGLLEWNCLSEALEGLTSANHAAIPNPNSKFPFIMKLCFSMGVSHRHPAPTSTPSKQEDN